ncbi:nucleotidyltransferase [Vibrio phage 5P1c]
MRANFNEIIPQDVLNFLNDIVTKTKGYDVYLGGGYLRDLYYNQLHGFGDWRNYHLGEGTTNQPMAPKDLDIFFIPRVNEDVQELPVLPKTYINYDVAAVDIPNVRENVKHVRGLFMKTLSTRDIQFIVYDKGMSMRELAEDMDISINQVMYSPDTQLSYMTDAFTNSHEYKTIHMLHKFEISRMIARLKRMEKKFPDYSLVHAISQEEIDFYESKTEIEKRMKRRGTSTGSFVSDEE